MTGEPDDTTGRFSLKATPAPTGPSRATSTVNDGDDPAIGKAAGAAVEGARPLAGGDRELSHDSESRLEQTFAGIISGSAKKIHTALARQPSADADVVFRPPISICYVAGTTCNPIKQLGVSKCTLQKPSAPLEPRRNGRPIGGRCRKRPT